MLLADGRSIRVRSRAVWKGTCRSMLAANARSERIHNRLLAALPSDDYAHLLPALEPITLAAGQSVYEPNYPMPYVYFPLRSIISLITLMDNGMAVEVAMVGNEGM